MLQTRRGGEPGRQRRSSSAGSSLSGRTRFRRPRTPRPHLSASPHPAPSAPSCPAPRVPSA